jgi:hypothetical protein
MRYLHAALVLATALVGGVAASPVRHVHQHQRFHEKKNVDPVDQEA